MAVGFAGNALLLTRFCASLLGMSQNVNPCAGTPLYMAPELFKGQRFTNKVDVFAYGVIV